MKERRKKLLGDTVKSIRQTYLDFSERNILERGVACAGGFVHVVLFFLFFSHNVTFETQIKLAAMQMRKYRRFDLIIRNKITSHDTLLPAIQSDT
jgi:hypothetical protein